MKRLLTASARFLLWPVRRFFDPRFQGLSRQIAESHEHLAAHADEGRREATARFFRSHERLDELYERLDQLHRGLQERVDQLYVGQLEQTSVVEELHALLRSDMDATSEAAAVMSHSLAEVLGGTEELGLRLSQLQNAVEFRGRGHAENGADEALSVTERAYALRASARLKPESAVMEIGRDDEALHRSLSALGYAVTAVGDVASLTTAEEVGPDTWGDRGSPGRSRDQTETFDAVFFLGGFERSTVDQASDPVAFETYSTRVLRRLRGLTKIGGTLVFTFRFSASEDYRSELDRLLEGWQIEDVTYFRKQDDGTWRPERVDVQDGDGDIAAMVTSIRTT